MMTNHTRTRAALAAVLALGVGGFSACGTTMRDLPIPGTGVSGDTIEVKAEFADALNLAVGAPVKVNGVDMGKVKSIEAADFAAEATLTIKSEAELHEGAQARLRYTTPLGELFVDITNPAEGAAIADRGTLEMKDTATAPTVEDALAQASLLVNGGGLEQLQTVTTELNKALGGNEADYRTLLERLTTFLTQANTTTSAIEAALTSLASLSTTLADREETIDRAVREITPAAKVLREKTPQFTALLAEVEKFTGAANETVQATRSQLLTLIRDVEPVLAEFAKNNGVFESSLREVINASGAADEIFATDYMNISIELHLDGLNANGLVEGTFAGLLSILGFNLDGLGLDLGPILGGILGTNRTSSTRTGGAASTPRSGATSGGTAKGPIGLNNLGGLLGGLLGGRS